MPEWLIGALASAPIWIVAALFVFPLFAVSSPAAEQRVWLEDKDNDSNEW